MPYMVGKNVWIDSNSTILQGVTIGDDTIVAAGSVAAMDVWSNTFVGEVSVCHIRFIEAPPDNPDLIPRKKIF